MLSQRSRSSQSGSHFPITQLTSLMQLPTIRLRCKRLMKHFPCPLKLPETLKLKVIFRLRNLLSLLKVLNFELLVFTLYLLVPSLQAFLELSSSFVRTLQRQGAVYKTSNSHSHQISARRVDFTETWRF